MKRNLWIAVIVLAAVLSAGCKKTTLQPKDLSALSESLLAEQESEAQAGLQTESQTESEATEEIMVENGTLKIIKERVSPDDNENKNDDFTIEADMRV